MKKLFFAALMMVALFPLAAMQDLRQPRMEITGLNATALPVVSVMINVFDDLGQPAGGLGVSDFRVLGELEENASVVSVTSFSDVNVPIAVVLAVDVSSSMAGTPIESAKAAASLFVESLGPDDPVAIVSFSSGANLIQDFTTNRDALMQAITALGFGGETFLYDGVMEAVSQASATDNTRRAVLLLSDGAQYDTGGFSHFTPDDALNAAVINGVPVYTIGLGFGTDRNYLQQLSTNTNALFRESPSPDELEAVYQELADLLRTQYEVLLDVDVPADGTVYELELEVTTPQGVATATGRLRAPIPVPVINLPELAGPIDEPTEVTFEVLADDALTAVEISRDGLLQSTFDEAPYTITIDPVTLAPGAHSLEVRAVDVNGDDGTATLDFEVAALPSEISIDPPLEGEIAETASFTAVISGQTSPDEVSLSQDDGVSEALADPYSFSVDPNVLAPGEHTVELTVTNAGGVTSSATASFSVPELPSQFTISGIDAGQTLEDQLTVQVDVSSSQAEIADIRFMVNGEALESSDGAATLDAASLQPGPSTLTVEVENALGQVTAESVDFSVAAFAPDVTVSGLETGDVLEEDREVSVDASGQTAINSIVVELDGADFVEADAGPLDFTLLVLEIAPGDHRLTVTASNDGGQSTTVDIDFTVAEAPSLTATRMAEVSPTPTATQEASPEPTEAGVEPTATNTIEAQAADTAEATETEAVAIVATDTPEATLDLTAAAEMEASETASADMALTTEAEQATVDAVLTESFISTVDAELTDAADEPTETATEFSETEAPTAVALAASEVPTEAPTVEASEVPTEAPSEEATTPPTITPIGTLIPAEAQTAPENPSIIPIVIIIVIIIVLLLLVYAYFNRRRQDERT